MKKYSIIFKDAFLALITFKRFTNMKRWMEISMGVEAWVLIGMICYILVKNIL